jgi:N-acetylglucosaminyldiphosphoundecaprenol N-acetyl-beta-D-mannosaminyltransferase
MKATEGNALVDVLGIHIAPIDMEGAVAVLAQALQQQIRGYVCLTGVHGIMEALRDPGLRPVYADSLLNLPDGIPTVWLGHWQGHKGMRQTTGPDLMIEMLRHPEFAGSTHFLYGGKPGIADELRHELERRFPAVRIIGTYTPPFRDFRDEEEQDFIDTIGRLRPDIVWVGISTPRQERFMQHMLPLLDVRLMFGVGAAFDFHTGRIKDSPAWVKQVGLQWFDRMLQDPKHLWKRYLRNNPAFLWHIVLQLTGLAHYPPAPSSAPINAVLQKAGPKL